MDRETFNVIAKVLHSDKRPTEVDRGEACKLFMAWKDNKDKAQRRAR
jgi:hypothetical protein